MCKIRLYAMAAAILISGTTLAGGLLTNTNSNIAFNRNFARDGIIGIDGVYSNPAGVAFMPNGFHLSFNVQNVYQTRTIESGMTVPALQGTPFAHPFSFNGGDENGVKKFKGEATVPVLPSIQAALNYDKWGFQAGFSLIGGGGKCTFGKGLGSFERTIAMIPALLYQTNQTYMSQYGLDLGLGSATPGYSVDSYIKGQQYIFGFQLGATYKVNEHLAAYAGMRFNYIYNKYLGSITDISANIGGNNERLYDYFSTRANEALTAATVYEAQAAATADEAAKAQLAQAAALYAKMGQTLDATKNSFSDKHLDCTQNGWGITPIIGLDYKAGRLNVGARLEFTNHLNIENDTKRDDTGLFAHGVNTPNDIPGIVTVGAQYEILPTLRVMGSYHYFFDKNAEMADGKQKKLSGNTQEFLAGVEWDITKDLLVSVGGQRTSYGLGDGGYLNDMSFVTSSYSLGFGAKFKIAKNASINVAYFFTDYENFDKEYDSTVSLAGQNIPTHNTDRFTRTNKVFGAGIDIDF